MTYPAVLLLVSGGHTLLAHMKSASDIELLGGTRDDSVGETYDKVGRMLGLDFPAGPLVDRLAKQGEPNIDFPRPLLHQGYEFSFSGLKSALSRHLNSGVELKKEDIAASFVEAVLDTLMHKCRLALKNNPSESLAIVGGVAASPQLRARAQALCDELGVKLSLPPVKWSTDNAAMIALAAWDYIDANEMIAPMPQARLPLAAF